MELHPRTGGRVVLDLDPDAPGIRYRAALYLPGTLHRGAAEVAPGGEVTFSEWEPPAPPAWLVQLARAFLRSEWRARQRGDDPAPWPARISRWRDDES
jgi:hypothetical protein